MVSEGKTAGEAFLLCDDKLNILCSHADVLQSHACSCSLAMQASSHVALVEVMTSQLQAPSPNHAARLASDLMAHQWERTSSVVS